MHRRHPFLTAQGGLPMAPTATQKEMRVLVGRERLTGLGLGWIDVGLLASARLGGMRLWSKDKALRSAARALKVAYHAA